MARKTILVLDPTARPKAVEREMARRLPDLNGRTLGILWNSKPNADHLLSRLEELLAERFELAGVVHMRKPTASIPAYEGVLEELSRRCQAVVNGVGD
jgi:hypothetical protein